MKKNLRNSFCNDSYTALHYLFDKEYSYDFTFEEIAIKLNMTTSECKGVYYRAIKKILRKIK
ncbi:hypothetical protein [Campylobacter sp. MG1]|uniref:hypothetical protein n=1 Tax=Campylobacter sp. MG1 TaxID=2976332 RepID=UPI00226C715B|nr:hypothetical protein [Campylobacter sp. MG1]